MLETERVFGDRVCEARAPHSHACVTRTRKLNLRLLWNRCREYPATVVVGMIADEIHSPWSGRSNSRACIEQILKRWLPHRSPAPAQQLIDNCAMERTVEPI